MSEYTDSPSWFFMSMGVILSFVLGYYFHWSGSKSLEKILEKFEKRIIENILISLPSNNRQESNDSFHSVVIT